MHDEKTRSEWQYFDSFDHDDGDCRKIEHHAKNTSTGEVKTLDYSPYREMPDAVFRAFVALGFPPRPDNGPWSDVAILRLAEEQRAAA